MAERRMAPTPGLVQATFPGSDVDYDAVELGAAVQKYARMKGMPASSVTAAAVLSIAKGLGWRKP